MNRTPVILALLVMAFSIGCDLPGKPNPADRPVRADEVLDFSLLYATRCAGCHGAEGKLGPAPPLNDPLFLAIMPDAELHRVISEGRLATPGVKTPMPAFAQQHGGPLTTAQVKALAEGIKKQWKPASPIPVGTPAYLKDMDKPQTEKPVTVAPLPHREDDAVQTAALKQEARLRLFSRACAGCHGSTGQGGKQADRAVGAINNPDFLALISDQALRRLIITGRPDLGMPAFDGKTGRPTDFQPLTSADVNELVILLAQWRKNAPTTK